MVDTASGPAGSDGAASGAWALSVVVSERFLNGLAATGIGDGIVVEPMRKTFQLPMMGPMELTLGMTIVGVDFQMDPQHGNRLFASIRATGTVEAHGETAMPLLPGVARVRGDVLVDPLVELREDGSFVAVLDVLHSDLVAMELEGIDGIEGDAEAQLQMSQMLFAAVGGELFDGLAERLGSIGLELDPRRAEAVADLGVAVGRADVRVEADHMVVGLPATPGLVGAARPVEVGGTRVGVSIASGALSVLVDQLARERLGQGIPFELDVDTRARRVGGRVRNSRLVASEGLPDLRSGIRYSVRPRLEGDRIELSLREAWIELPPVVPLVEPINRISRWLGGAASRAPLTLSLPARVSLPVRPGSTATMRVSVVDIDVGDDGVHVTVDAKL
jgi:hypothetical protein